MTRSRHLIRPITDCASQDKLKKEEELKKGLNVKLEVAKFLQVRRYTPCTRSKGLQLLAPFHHLTPLSFCCLSKGTCVVMLHVDESTLHCCNPCRTL